MITFGTIAMMGDVNVNTIAPGVAAALATTVMGLIVAIPVMFGYNQLSTRIRTLTTTTEVFANELMSRIALGRSRTEG
jgi:biopolymer transport protein ExbB